MTALRQLSAIYIAMAGVFLVAMALSAHPDWGRAANAGARAASRYTMAVAALAERNVLRPGWTAIRREGVALREKLAGAFRNAPATRTAKIAMHPAARLAPEQPARPIDKPAAINPPAHPVIALRSSPPALRTERPELVPQPATPSAAQSPLPPLDPAEITRVERRMKDNLTGEMLANFELFLYVSKADTGPWAQHMYVFQKQAGGDLALLYNWPVSTGRERIELDSSGRRMATFTPQGYYELDPKRSYVRYHSTEWNQPMPYSLFFNWIRDGNETGFAIHAATGQDIALLGSRASAGCVHLAPDNARLLFGLIRAHYRGLRRASRSTGAPAL